MPCSFVVCQTLTLFCSVLLFITSLFVCSYFSLSLYLSLYP